MIILKCLNMRKVFCSSALPIEGLNFQGFILRTTLPAPLLTLLKVSHMHLEQLNTMTEMNNSTGSLRHWA